MRHFLSSAAAVAAESSLNVCRRPLIVPLLIVLAIAAVPPKAKAAAILSLTDASAIVQSTVTDTDTVFLSGLFGFQSGQTINFSSSSNSAAWSGSLSGTYLGTGLSVSYLGNLSGYPSGALTWTGTGTYGANAWTGSGSMTIAETSSTTFQVTLAESLDIGGSTASLNSVIPGTVLPDGDIVYGDSSDSEVGSGTALLDGVRKYDVYYSYRKEDHRLVQSDIVLVRKGRPLPPPPPGWRNIYLVKPISDDLFDITGKITSTPEPSNWGIVFGGLALIGALVRRHRRASSAARTDCEPAPCHSAARSSDPRSTKSNIPAQSHC